MARKKRSISDFKRVAIKSKEQHQVKGGHKASPAGPGYQGSFIWEGIDIRTGAFSKRVKSISKGVSFTEM